MLASPNGNVKALACSLALCTNLASFDLCQNEQDKFNERWRLAMEMQKLLCVKHVQRLCIKWVEVTAITSDSVTKTVSVLSKNKQRQSSSKSEQRQSSFEIDHQSVVDEDAVSTMIVEC